MSFNGVLDRIVGHPPVNLENKFCDILARSKDHYSRGLVEERSTEDFYQGREALESFVDVTPMQAIHQLSESWLPTEAYCNFEVDDPLQTKTQTTFEMRAPVKTVAKVWDPF